MSIENSSADAEIEITPEMVEAGVKAASVYDSTDSLEMIVTDVFLSMIPHWAQLSRDHS